MKKVIFISALAIAAAVSCTKSDIVDTAVDNAIKFENYVGRDAQTKAAIVSGVTSVNVNAWLHEKGAAATGFQADFMTNQAVTKSGDTWTYSPAKYWPNEAQAVSFVGWVPGNNIEVEHATLTFEVPSDIVDLAFSALDSVSTAGSSCSGMISVSTSSVALAVSSFP